MVCSFITDGTGPVSKKFYFYSSVYLFVFFFLPPSHGVILSRALIFIETREFFGPLDAPLYYCKLLGD